MTNRPAENLEGKNLDNGWTVIEKITRNKKVEVFLGYGVSRGFRGFRRNFV